MNNPHIAGIYGLEEADGDKFLVLELVEGQTLAERITQAHGPLPLDEALRVASEIVDALEAAHEKGIIHRDLKPANVALTLDGQVKVLDFGLARYEAGESDGVSDLTHSPTLAYGATQAGVILGTAAYMSPEQSKGRAVDKRSDVWAFGCVLFEMLSGKKAFEGEDVSDTLASILRGEPDWNALAPEVPPAIRTLIKRSLEKDRRKRIPDFSVVRFLMEEASAAPAPNGASPGISVERASRMRTIVPWLVTAMLAIALVAVVVMFGPGRTRPMQPVRVSAQIGVDASLVTTLGASAVLSPDGSLLAISASTGADQPSLYTRRLDQLQATRLSSTEGAVLPFFSPDGQWIAFFAQGKLKKVSTAGGAAVTLCDAPNARGGAWGADGAIIFQPNNTGDVPLQRVSAAGGTPEPLIKLAEGEGFQRWPDLLPGSKALIYSSLPSQNGGDWNNAEIVAQVLPNGPRRVLVKGAHYGRYVATGHIVYLHDGTVFAAPLDIDRLELTGPPIPVVESVASTTNNGAGQLSLARNGTLAYVGGASAESKAPIDWLEQSGRTTSMRATRSDWSSPRFSPDGTRLAVDISDGTQADIWVYEWARDTLSRVTFDPTDDLRPVWTPDSRRITFASKRGGTQNIYWQAADGTGEVQKLTDGPYPKVPGSWHPSGKFLSYFETTPKTNFDIMILPMEGNETQGWKPGTPTVFLGAPYVESTPEFSPDGRWLAYMSTESGGPEIYVRPFPGPGGKWQVTNGGADDPTWSRKTNDFFYFGGNNSRLWHVAYSTDGGSFRVGKPQVWAETVIQPRPRAPSRDLDLHPDGQRFAIAPGLAAAQIDKVVLVFNFFDELKRLAATK